MQDPRLLACTLGAHPSRRRAPADTPVSRLPSARMYRRIPTRPVQQQRRPPGIDLARDSPAPASVLQQWNRAYSEFQTAQQFFISDPGKRYGSSTRLATASADSGWRSYTKEADPSWTSNVSLKTGA